MKQLEAVAKENQNIEADPWRFDDFSLQEHAIEIVSRLLGFTTTKLLAERKKPFPNKQILDELETRCASLSAEQRQIYFGDKDIMKHVIDKYGPEVNEHLVKIAQKTN